VKPPEPPKPVYQYGAVINPVTDELYPVMVYENGKEYISPAYEEEINQAQAKPTALGKNTFDWATFISGLEFDDSMSGAAHHPAVGGAAGMLIGGITSINESWEHLYLDIHYYKEPITGQKQAIIRCGESSYVNMFEKWGDYRKAVSLKSLKGSLLESVVDNMAKEQYRLYKGVTPDDSYEYDIEFTLNESRKGDRYVSKILFGEDGKMYEYATIYPNEKVVIVVKSKFGLSVIERLDITAALNPVTELPADKAALFTIERQ